MVDANTVCKRIVQTGAAIAAGTFIIAQVYYHNSHEMGRERQQREPKYIELRIAKERTAEYLSRLEQISFKDFKQDPGFFYQTRKDLDLAISNELTIISKDSELARAYDAETKCVSEADKRFEGVANPIFFSSLGLSFLGCLGTGFFRKK